jgi:predicted GIY-YIG superfamily endonuclease
LITIYTLIDPRDLSVRYVGATTDIKRRFKDHTTHMGKNGANPQKKEWIRELRTMGLKPEMEFIECTTEKAFAKEREKFWIDFFLSEEEPLLNIAETEKVHFISGRRLGSKRTKEEMDSMIEEYQRTGKRPSGWTRQSLSQNLIKRGLR